MATSSKRFSYTIAYKLQVVQYAKKHGNRAAERHFRPPPTEKIIRQWRKQEELRETGNKAKHNLHQVPAKWPQLEKDLCTWIMEHRNLGFCSYNKNDSHRSKKTCNGHGSKRLQGHCVFAS